MYYDTQIQGEQMNINTSFFFGFFDFILSSQGGPLNRSFKYIDYIDYISWFI